MLNSRFPLPWEVLVVSERWQRHLHQQPGSEGEAKTFLFSAFLDERHNRTSGAAVATGAIRILTMIDRCDPEVLSKKRNIVILL